MAKKKRIKKVHKVVGNKEARIIKNKEGNEAFVVLETETYYTMKNMRPGLLFFAREDGKYDKFEGKEIKSDITQKEFEMLIQTKDFKNGWLIEEGNEDISEDKIYNKNALSDGRLSKFLEKNKDDIEKITAFIGEMDSEFAIKRMKEALVKFEMSSSLFLFCEYRLKQIEEKNIQKNKAPIDNFKE